LKRWEIYQSERVPPEDLESFECPVQGTKEEHDQG
jgi:hypothetical protein